MLSLLFPRTNCPFGDCSSSVHVASHRLGRGELPSQLRGSHEWFALASQQSAGRPYPPPLGAGVLGLRRRQAAAWASDRGPRRARRAGDFVQASERDRLRRPGPSSQPQFSSILSAQLVLTRTIECLVGDGGGHAENPVGYLRGRRRRLSSRRMASKCGRSPPRCSPISSAHRSSYCGTRTSKRSKKLAGSIFLWRAFCSNISQASS